MNFSKPPKTFDELCQRADDFRSGIVEHADGMRWCWIAEYDSDRNVYFLGVQVEGQLSWQQFGLLQQGSGSTAFDWIRRLNERDGLPSRLQQEFPSARACLSADEAEVCILLRGVFCGWDVAPSTIELARQAGVLPSRPNNLRHIFTLEVDIANDLISCLFLLNLEKRLPIPSADIRDVDVIQDEESGETTFFIPSELEFDAHDEAIVTLVIDLQTAADLFAVMQEKFWY